MRTLLAILLLLSSSAALAKVHRDLIPVELEAEVWAFKVCGGWNFQLVSWTPLDDWKIIEFKCLASTKPKGKSK